MKCKATALGSSSPFPCRGIWNVSEIPNGEGGFGHLVALEGGYVGHGLWDDAELISSKAVFLPVLPTPMEQVSALCTLDVHSVDTILDIPLLGPWGHRVRHGPW